MVKGSEDVDVCSAATRGLSAIAEKGRHARARGEAIQVLDKVMRDRELDQEVRNEAVGVLWDMGKRAAVVEAQGEMLQNKEEERYIRSEALRYLDRVARDEEEDEDIRGKAITILGEIAGDGDQDKTVRMDIIGYFERIGGEAARKALYDIVENKEVYKRILGLIKEFMGKITINEEKSSDIYMRVRSILDSLEVKEVIEGFYKNRDWVVGARWEDTKDLDIILDEKMPSEARE